MDLALRRRIVLFYPCLLVSRIRPHLRLLHGTQAHDKIDNNQTMAIPSWLQATALDVRFALRSWRKRPGLIAVVVLMLAVAIGSTTPIFTVVKAIVMDQLPYRNPDRV